MRAQIGPTDDHSDDQYCPNKYKIVIKHKNKNIFFSRMDENETEMVDASKRLPKGWSQYWSKQHQKHYFFNQTTRESTYEHPA